jgi:RNA polymerase sigma factor (sigma-70 family)
MNKAQDIIADLKRGDKKAIERLYLDNKSKFIGYMRKNGWRDEHLEDVYQDAIVVVCEKARKGQLDDLKTQLSTYLIAIGKYITIKAEKRDVKMTDVDAIPAELLEWETYEEEQRNLMVRTLQQKFSLLGAKCQEVLRMFYYEEMKSDEIHVKLGYPNKDVLKSQKSRCLKQLRELCKP